MPCVQWVTGAQGFIGLHLVRQLGLSGQSVVRLGNAPSAPVDNVEDTADSCLITGMISDALLDRAASIAGMPEVIYHLAGGSSVGASLEDPGGDREKTVGGTATLLAWLKARNVRTHLVVASSAAVYGAGHDVPACENAEPRPFSPYGQHKFEMECLCKDAVSGMLSISMIRLFSVYGPGLRKQLLWDMNSRIADGENPIILGGIGSEMRDWTHVSEVTRLLTFIGNQPVPGYRLINGGSGIGTRVSDIAAQVALAWKERAPKVGFSGVARAGDPVNLVADSTRLAATGFQWNISVADGISEYVSWFTRQLS